MMSCVWFAVVCAEKLTRCSVRRLRGSVRQRFLHVDRLAGARWAAEDQRAAVHGEQRVEEARVAHRVEVGTTIAWNAVARRSWLDGDVSIHGFHWLAWSKTVVVARAPRREELESTAAASCRRRASKSLLVPRVEPCRRAAAGGRRRT